MIGPNIVQQQGDLESFSDQMLMQESSQPSGRYPPFLVMTEMQRRRDLRQRAQAQNYQPQPTVQQKLVSDLSGGIPSVDQNGPIPGTPNMQQGIAKFANGGMVDRYQVGGPTDDPGYFSRDMGLLTTPMDWLRKLNAYRQKLNAYRQAGLERYEAEQAEMLGRVPPVAPQVAPQAAPQPAPPAPGMPNPGVPMGRFPASQPGTFESAPTKEWGTLIPPGDPYDLVGDVRGDFAGWEEIMEGLRDAHTQGAEAGKEYERQLNEEFGPAITEQLSGLAEQYRSAIEEDPSALEQEIQDARRTPEEMRNQKLAVALGGLGSLISGARQMGDIGAGMGNVNREIMATDQAMREEDLRLATQAGLLEEQRKARNLQYGTQAAQTDISAAEVGRDIARQSYEINSSITESARRIAELDLSMHGSMAQALAEARAMEIQIEEAARDRRLSKALNPASIMSAFQTLTKVIMDGLGSPEEIEEATRQRNMLMRVFEELMKDQMPGLPGDVFEGDGAEPDLDALLGYTAPGSASPTGA